MQQLPPFNGMQQSDIEAILRRKGYTQVTARSGGDVWTKATPDGNTAAIRLDPAKVRTPPRGFADEVKHAHKEIVPTSNVSGGNYRGASHVLDDSCIVSTNPRDLHIPIL
ncbi:hypothetical protein V8J88_10960 [Massilia sp. W12]|uniref:hypothetical protein n=1 Tax=Massilia sp. W12 TaxID=3126507 RepID=UPI0030D31281